MRPRIMNAKKMLSLWGLKWNPFSPELPSEGLLTTAKIENFGWRIEQLVQEGGFALITGESGIGKSVALRIVAERLAALREVVVGVLERPQSKTADFYRELGDVFLVKLRPSNRWGGFQALRERWRAHLASSRIRPVLLIDERGEEFARRCVSRTNVSARPWNTWSRPANCAARLPAGNAPTDVATDRSRSP